MRQETKTASAGAFEFRFISRTEAQLMLYMMTGGTMDDLSPAEIEIWEPLLEEFKDFTLSI